MREENVATLREFSAWLQTAPEDGSRHAAEMLALPPAAWDDWWTRNAHAALLHTLQGLLDAAAAGDPRALPITEHVLRHVDHVSAPAHAHALRKLVRAHAWR